MSTWVHEWVVAPIAFAAAFLHVSRALGARRAAVELLALVAYGFALEWVAMAVFGSHRYGAGWTIAPAGVPLAVAVVWSAVITTGMALAVRAGARSALHRGALAASLGIALDLLMEPVASRLALWEWTPPGPWLDVPIGNFVGWAVIVGGYTFGAERWAGAGPIGREALRRVLLAAGAIAALVAVGFVWKALGAERLFDGTGGWIAWLAWLSLPVWLARTGASPASTTTLAGRLGVTPGLAPHLVFAIVGATFAIDALYLGGGDLAVVALGSAASLGGFYLKSFLRLVSAESLGERASSS